MEQSLELSKVEEALFARADARQVPIYGGFELTPYCNLSCKMCYIHEVKPGLSLLTGEQWIALGKQAAAAGNLYIVLTGGEPMMHPDFKQIYKGLIELGIVLTINTNGTLVDEAMADFLAANMPRRVNISLYGPNEEVYEALCGNRAGYAQTIRAIELLLARNIPVKINITVNTINFPYLDEMLAICGKYQLAVEFATYLFEPIRKLEPGKQSYRLDPARMARARDKWDQYRYNERERYAHAVLAHQGLEQFEESRRDKAGIVPIRCRAGRSSFWICWNGRMNVCVNMVEPQADVLKLGFAEAWEAVKKEGTGIQVPAKCDSCSLRMFCMTCAAIGLHQYGVFDKTPEIMCQATEEYARILTHRFLPNDDTSVNIEGEQNE